VLAGRCWEALGGAGAPLSGSGSPSWASLEPTHPNVVPWFRSPTGSPQSTTQCDDNEEEEEEEEEIIPLGSEEARR